MSNQKVVVLNAAKMNYDGLLDFSVLSPDTVVYEDSAPEEIMTIYAFTGERRSELATSDGRFLLAEKGETLYSASAGNCDWAEEMSEEEMRSMFHFIFLDWNSGEI